ncbi:hypothetical protein ACB098_04G036100 [Castanea mollissima]
MLESCLIDSKGNYTSNSAYNTNLNQVLSSLSSNTEIDYRFYKFSYGKSPDKVYSLGLCRGDTKPDICRSCLNKATKLLPQRCPNQKEAIGCYDDCMLRYSFRNIYGIMEASPFFYTWDNYTVSANVDQFNLDLRTLLDSQRVQAAAGGSLRKFAAGKAAAPNNQTPYSLVQCTPDLSDQDCRDCLFGAMGDIPNCCDGKQGGRVIRPSCNLRFEVALFYDPSVSPPASNNTPAAKGTNAIKLKMVSNLIWFQGKLSDGQVIAVKRLSKNSSQGDLEFKNEVSLLGFCLEGIERLLIYEFVPNGSLDNFIFDPIKCVQLDWARRYNIIGGIVGASNILLDFEMNPKISDFSMARLFELDQSEGNTSRIVGTYGYMSPEYAMHGQFSAKSDVFSFGILLLEIVSGRKNSSFRNGENIENLLSYARKNWKQGIVSNLADPTLTTGSTTEIMRCIHIGLLFVQENVAHRPTMASVVLMLNSYSITLPIPLEPGFFMNNGTESKICLQWEHDSRVT